MEHSIKRTRGLTAIYKERRHRRTSRLGSNCWPSRRVYKARAPQRSKNTFYTDDDREEYPAQRRPLFPHLRSSYRQRKEEMTSWRHTRHSRLTWQFLIGCLLSLQQLPIGPCMFIYFLPAWCFSRVFLVLTQVGAFLVAKKLRAFPVARSVRSGQRAASDGREYATYLTQREAAEINETLMVLHGFSMDQLMVGFRNYYCWCCNALVYNCYLTSS